jgi:hypothetical protein
MNTHVGDFLWMEIGKVTADQLEKQLIAEQYIQELYEELANDDKAYNLLRRLKQGEGGLLRDLENVLLRFDAPKKWRDFLKATLKRKGEDKVGNLRGLIKWVEPLLPSHDPPAEDHPVMQATKEVGERIRREMKERCSSDEELGQWQKFLDDLERAIHIAAARTWLCLSLRRVFDEPTKQSSN